MIELHTFSGKVYIRKDCIVSIRPYYEGYKPEIKSEICVAGANFPFEIMETPEEVLKLLNLSIYTLQKSLKVQELNYNERD